MPIKLDFTGSTDQGGFEPLPDAKGYSGTIVKCEQEEFGGKDCITFTIGNIVRPDGTTENEARRQWDNYFLQANAMWRLKGVLRRFGFEIDDEGEFDFEPETVEGVDVTFDLETTPWQNKKYQNVVNLQPAGGINY